jgi:hypothetical protein
MILIDRSAPAQGQAPPICPPTPRARARIGVLASPGDRVRDQGGDPRSSRFIEPGIEDCCHPRHHNAGTAIDIFTPMPAIAPKPRHFETGPLRHQDRVVYPDAKELKTRRKRRHLRLCYSVDSRKACCGSQRSARLIARSRAPADGNGTAARPEPGRAHVPFATYDQSRT